MSTALKQHDQQSAAVRPIDASGFLPIVGIVIGFAPLLVAHFQDLWSKSQYQYFPFVLAAVAYLFWNRYRAAMTRDQVRPGSPGVNACLVFIAWIMLAVGIALYDGWLGMFGLIVVLGVIVRELSQTAHIVNLLGIWCLTWLILPLPLDIDDAFVFNLQLLSSKLSSLILDLIKVNHLMSGNVLELPTRQLFVDRACSGIVSVMAVITCSAIYCVWSNRSLLHTICLLIASVGWAVLLNVVRISTIAIAQSWWEYDLSSGTPHEMLGLILFGITFIAMISTDQILAFALAPIQMTGLPDDVRHTNILIVLWNRIVNAFTPVLPAENEAMTGNREHPVPFRNWKLVGGAFALLGIIHIVVWGAYSSPASDTLLTKAHTFTKETLSANTGDWKLETFDSIEREANADYGEFSKAFGYVHQASNTVVNISLDFPYQGSWHELSVCYQGSGWGTPARVVVDETNNPAHDNWSYVRADYERGDGRVARLLYSICDASGQQVSPPTGRWAERLWRRMRRRGPSSTWPQMLQIQAWVETDKQISDDLAEDVLSLFIESRRQLHAYLATEK